MDAPSPASPAKTAPVDFLPFEVFPVGDDPLSLRRQTQWLWIFLALGLAARVVRYLLRSRSGKMRPCFRPIFLHRGYLELLRPLDYYQVAPTLFLWCQLTVVKLLGFSEWTLRLVPFLCGIGSLFLFRHLAGLMLRGTALVLAFGVFAVAYPPIRYTAEAKPYGCDLLLALLMLTLAVHWLRRREESRWLWALGRRDGAGGRVFLSGRVRGRRHQSCRWLYALVRAARPLAVVGRLDRLQSAAGRQLFAGAGFEPLGRGQHRTKSSWTKPGSKPSRR